MSNAWITALKEFNKGKTFQIPKKGSVEYAKVQKLMKRNQKGGADTGQPQLSEKGREILSKIEKNIPIAIHNNNLEDMVSLLNGISKGISVNKLISREEKDYLMNHPLLEQLEKKIQSRIVRTAYIDPNDESKVYLVS